MPKLLYPLMSKKARGGLGDVVYSSWKGIPYARSKGDYHDANSKKQRQNDYNLNIPRYIDITEEESPIDVQQTIDELVNLKKDRAQSEEKVTHYLKELGYKV